MTEPMNTVILEKDRQGASADFAVRYHCPSKIAEETVRRVCAQRRANLLIEQRDELFKDVRPTHGWTEDNMGPQVHMLPVGESLPAEPKESGIYVETKVYDSKDTIACTIYKVIVQEDGWFVRGAVLSTPMYEYRAVVCNRFFSPMKVSQYLESQEQGDTDANQPSQPGCLLKGSSSTDSLIDECIQTIPTYSAMSEQERNLVVYGSSSDDDDSDDE